MSIGEEQVECPLCMEPLELDDINFFPCTCGYQICRFCWHRIRTDENGLCPACRKAYPEDPAEFKPLTEDELQRIKRERKMKDLQRKQKAAENRKHLANVRVVQKNLVFVVGLSQRLGDPEVLKKQDYFGKYGKILKVVINQSTSYAGSQGPSASAYVTYLKPEDALRAIQAVNNIHVDGRTLKASLGTTKYCSHFLRGTQCPKGDCMYLHELGDEHASFTKEEMQQGKHQEYEQKLYETYMNHLNNVSLSNQTSTQSNKQGQTTRKKCQSPATTTQTPPPSASQNNTTESWPSLQPGNQKINLISFTESWPSLQPGQQQQGGKHTTDKPTHKRTTSTDLQNRQTPDSSNRPSPQSDCCSTSSNSSSTSSSSHHTQQVSPPQPQTPPIQHTTQPHRPTAGASPHNNITQVPPQTRKPLYGDTSQDNMSLFSSSGFPVTRNPSKPPVTLATTAPFTDHPSLTQDTPTNHEIPDTISVTSSTDWQAAFGFQPSTMATHIGVDSNNVMNNTVGSAVTQQAEMDNNDAINDDDLGFDPWNESTKALQDLIEKEAVSSSQNSHQYTNHLPSTQPPHLVAPDRTKPLPPGFTQNHISAFNQNPLIGSSRMMNLMKMTPQQDMSPMGGGLHQTQHNSNNDPFNMKTWQEGLRALLPNINIHFSLAGGHPPPQQQAAQQTGHTLPLHLQQQQQQQLPQTQHTTQISSPHKIHNHTQQQQHNWDLSFDPAIVTSGQVAETNLLEEPHWMASLHHLTEEPTNQNIPHTTNNKFLPMGLNTQSTAPPPGFQNTIRPPLQLAGTGLPPHKLVDGFQ